MDADVIVAGAGYAGVSAVKRLQKSAPELNLTWITGTSFHEVKHEIHRVIRTPSIGDDLAIPIDHIATSSTTVYPNRVEYVDPQQQYLELDSGQQCTYAYLLLTVGGRTAYFGIPGLEEHAICLEQISDARRINQAVERIDEPRVVIGGGGLSGVQTAGEIRSLDPTATVTVVEALDEILPRVPTPLRQRVAAGLQDHEVDIRTASPIVEATASEVIVEGEEALPYDILIWTGGVTGRQLVRDSIEQERNRIAVDQTLRSSNDQIFACGDGAVITQPNGIAPTSAQAAWQAGPTAASNITAVIRDQPLTDWTFRDKGTLISIGDTAYAHGIIGIPVSTFNAAPAAMLKKLIAARWIADIGSYRRAMRLWPKL